ncbi:MAG: hypothetical protein ACTHKB_10175, partial [Burkholderiaceae bacterium]
AAATPYPGRPASGSAQWPPCEPIAVAALAAIGCPDNPDDCRQMAALFDLKHYRILIRDELDTDTPYGKSFIVHELVHVLQYKQSGRDVSGCEEVLASELAAYAVQNAYLRANGIYAREGAALQFMTCPKDGDSSGGSGKEDAPTLVPRTAPH